MPCPFFLPSEPCDQALWPFPARLPLGAGYAGRCMAPGHEGVQPQTDELKQFCNLGYSSACSRLPHERPEASGPDANRFFVSQSGSELIVTFCSERNHAPIEHSVLRFNTALRTWSVAHKNACVQRQAECAVESFLRRRAEREGHDFSRAVGTQKSSGALAPADGADDRPEASGPTTDDLLKTDDLSSSPPSILPVEFSGA